MLKDEDKRTSKGEKLSFEIIEIETPDLTPIQLEPKDVTIQQKKSVAEKKVEPEQAVKPVFGISKDTVTTNDPNAVVVKTGNTIVKEVDNEILESDTALPVPKPAYLVSQMPVLQKEIKPEYPSEAREKNIEGKVVLNVLIDDLGKVRNVKVIEDPGFGMAEKAKEAMFGYVFQPAKISGKPVAVEVRYVVTFELL
ncbi:MAG: TonB family protein [Deltaproteobacteria bacterium]|nr:TonB family protein [Deltaproteobacteria bacterium]